jgi:PAS domain S-box-containing protein
MNNKNEYKLESILEFSLDIICVVDAGGRFIKISNASTSSWGYNPDELTGRRFIDLVHQEDHERTQEAMKEVLMGISHLNFRNRYIRKDGSVISMLWSSNWDSKSKKIYCVGRQHMPQKSSTTNQEYLEVSNKYYEYISRATYDAVWDWDLVTGKHNWGEGYESVFGYNSSELPNDITSWTNYIHPDDSQTVIESVYKVIDSRETHWQMEYRFRKGDGSYTDVADRGYLICNKRGKPIRMIGALHDNSERKRSIEELNRFTRELFKRNRELQQFGYLVSHNLRAPVANISGLITLLETEGDNPAMVASCIDKLKTSASRLDDTIIDLSQITSITGGTEEIDKEKVDLEEKIEKVKLDLSKQFSRTQASVEITGGPRVFYTHKAYFHSIFLNLISNALKYRSDLPPLISIDITSTEETVIINVTDNGIGIDLQRYGEDVFKPYRRFYHAKEGKGLGLFLVKGHVESLNGVIFVQSELGTGSTFTMMFPKDIQYPNPIRAAYEDN